MPDFFNTNILQTELDKIGKKQRDMDFYASLNPQADAQTGGVAKEEAEANWLQNQIKEMTPQSIYEELMQKEWKDKKAPGKILMALGEFARGANQRSRYVPFSERLQGRAQKEYDSRSKALTGLERIMSAERKTADTLASREQVAAENNMLRYQLGMSKTDIDKFRAETDRMKIEAQAKTWAQEVAQGDRKLTMQEKRNLWEMAPEKREEILTRRLATDPEFIAADSATRNKMIKEASLALDAGKMMSAAIRGQQQGASWKANQLVRNGMSGVYDKQTGELTKRNHTQIWNKRTGGLLDFDPESGQPVLPGRYVQVDPKLVDAVNGFNDTANQGRAALGGLTSQWQQGKKIAKVWDSQFGAFIRRYVDGPEKEQWALTAEQGMVETAAINAALMHSRAQIGYRPPEALYMSLRDHIISSPMGSYQAKVRSMAAFVLLTELSSRAKLAEASGEDVSRWGLASPLTAARIGQAINTYAQQVEAGLNPDLPKFDEIMGLPPVGAGTTLEDKKVDDYGAKSAAFGIGQ